MDWKYKHFVQQAVFNGHVGAVSEAAREAVSKSLGQIEPIPDGFIARGRSGFHKAEATVRVSSVAGGTEVKVELLVERWSNTWGFILWDPFGLYNSVIDKWFAGISARLSSSEEAAVVSKSTPSYRVQRGCAAGCLVYLAAVVCLGTAGVAADKALFPHLADTTPGPFTGLGSIVALALGIAAFVYVRFPEGPLAKWVKGLRGGGGE